MKNTYLNIALLITNLAILYFLTTSQKVPKEEVSPILKAQIIELVDNKGQTRAQLKVEDDGTAMFRMRDAQGDIRIKMGVNNDGSGLVLLNNKTEVGIHALAKNSGTTLTLMSENGKKQVIQP